MTSIPDEQVLSQATLYGVCRAEGVRSSKSFGCGVLLPSLLWCWDASAVIEIGTYEGFSSLAIGMQLQLMGPTGTGARRRLAVCDIEDECVAESLRLLEEYAPDVDAEGIVFDSAAVDWRSWGQFDFAYIDGDHSGPAMAADLRQVVPAMDPDKAAILMHDYCPRYPGLVAAIQEFIHSSPEWSMAALPSKLSYPMALATRSAPAGLEVGKEGRMRVAGV